MGKTGVKVNNIDLQTVDILLSRILALLSQNEFVEFLLPWIYAIVDLNQPIETENAKNLLRVMSE